MDLEERERELKALQKLNIKLKKYKRRREKRESEGLILRGKSGKVLGYAMRAGVELAAAIIIATMIGVVLDRWVGSGPWGLLIMFFIGTIAGFVNFYRALIVVQKGGVDGTGNKKGS